MFREMRRKKQLMPNEAAEEILRKGTAGVLGVSGDDGYPYTVPISYVYDSEKIYFHSAQSGHKLDGIKKNNKVSFCVIDKDQIVPEEFTTYFRSVVVFGKARILDDDAEKMRAIEMLVRKYSPGFESEGAKAIQKGWEQFLIVEITIDHMTGKEAIELVTQK